MKKILVIDDQASMRMLIQSSLEELGYQVITAADGAIGWEKILEESPDLIITDLNMPGVYGLELLERVRNTEQTRELPVLCITSDDNIDTKQRAVILGATGWVQKPFNVVAWDKALCRIFGKRCSNC